MEPAESVWLDDGLHGLVSGECHDEHVLWVHGYTLDATVWGTLWEHLPGLRHLAIDLPGHGRSRALTPDDDLPGIARTLCRIATAQRTRHVVGLSFGSLVGLQVAMEMSAELVTLTLGAPCFGGGPHDRAAESRNIELARLYKARGSGPWMTDLWMTAPPAIFTGAARIPALFRAIRAIVDRHTWVELAAGGLQRFTSHVHRAADFARVTASTLVVCGEYDMPAFLRSAHLLSRTLPSCRRVYMEQTGHLCLLEDPSRAAAEIVAHLRAARASQLSPPPF